METTTVKDLLESLRDDKEDILDYKGMKYGDFDFSNHGNLSSIAMKYVFFFKNDKFSYEKLTNQKKNFNWLNRLLKSFYRVCLEEKESQAYEYFNRLFSLHYDDITQNYCQFLKALKQMKSIIKYDLCTCLICLLSFLNGNNKFLKLLSDLGKNKDIISLRKIYDKKREKSLWYVLTDYCIINKIPILFKYNDSNINAKRFLIDIGELNCFVDICQVNNSFQKFVQTLYGCMQDCKDLRINKTMKLKNFIQDIFLMINICLKNCESWDDSILSVTYNEIYKIAYNYTSDNFNENYVDFVIHYITKYNLSNDDFFHLFLNGLNEGNFNKTFKYLHLKEDINSIDVEKIIQTLINKMIKRKKNKNNNINGKNTNEIQNEKSLEININDQSATLIESKPRKDIIINKKDNNEEEENKPEKELDAENISLKEKEIELEKALWKVKKNEKISLNESNELFIKEIKDKFQNIENEMSILKEKIEDINEENSFLLSENSKKDIKIRDLSQDINEIKKDIEIISFRDLSKKILDNMISFVAKRDKTIFKGYIKRKQKLEVLNQKYNYDGIIYMKKPIEEITNNYYSSNSKSHVPQIVKIIRGKPFGLVEDPAGEIAKRFFKIMITDKNNDAINFINEKLSIKKEINELYLK